MLVFNTAVVSSGSSMRAVCLEALPAHTSSLSHAYDCQLAQIVFVHAKRLRVS